MAYTSLISVKLNPQNELQRIFLTSKNPTYFQQFIPGSHYNATKKCLSIPPDELNFWIIKKHCSDKIKLTEQAHAWLYSKVEDNKKALEIKRGYSFSAKWTDFILRSYLYDYQQQDVHFMHYTKRILNANEMGTGKTIESVALCTVIDAKKVLIIVSNTLK